MLSKSIVKTAFAFLAGFIPVAAHADYYMYVVNPDFSTYHISWNGPGPNSMKKHPEFGEHVVIACWIVHDGFSHVANAGISDNALSDTAFWVEPKVPYGIGGKMQIQTDSGQPYIDMGDAGNTAWVGVDQAHTFRVWDCGV